MIHQKDLIQELRNLDDYFISIRYLYNMSVEGCSCFSTESLVFTSLNN